MIFVLGFMVGFVVAIVLALVGLVVLVEKGLSL
jgi:hypothetical protein